MRRLGLGLFLVGIVLAACYAARPVSGVGRERLSPAERISAWAAAAGLPFAAGMLLVVGGGLLARFARRREADAPSAPQAVGEHQAYAPEGTGDLARREQPGVITQEHGPAHPELGPRYVLAAIQQKLDGLSLGNVSRDASELHRVLDEILEQDVPDFLSHRERLIARIGLSRFAELVGQFAIMERNVARAWSALIDEAWAEVEPCLDRARAGVGEARRVLG